MGRTLHRLTAVKLKTTTPGLYGDGNSLWLQVTPAKDGKGVNRSWIFRYAIDGRRRHMGLGSAGVLDLKTARERARAACVLLLDGVDPLAHRDAERASKVQEAARAMTFRQCAEQFLKEHEGKWSSPKHAA